MKNRGFKNIFLGLLIGALIGTLLGEILSFILPDGSTVEQFFINSTEFVFGSFNKESSIIDLGILAFNFGIKFKFNVCSLIGFGIAYYLLKYLR